MQTKQTKQTATAAPEAPRAAALEALKRWKPTPAPNKAQPQQSPLPWKQVYDWCGLVTDADGMAVLQASEPRANAALIVRAVNHADKLAEALRGILSVNLDKELKAVIGTSPINQGRAALAAYEAAQ